MASNSPSALRSLDLQRILLLARAVSPDDSNNEIATTQAKAARLQQFELFFYQYERQIIAYLCRMLGNEQNAYDISQETFIRAWQHFDTLQERTQARAWLYRVATNLALNLIERMKRYDTVILDETVFNVSNPEQMIVERNYMQQTLLRLTPKQRSVLLLYIVHELPCDEIGKIIGMSRDAVKMALLRGREQFRRYYQEGLRK